MVSNSHLIKKNNRADTSKLTLFQKIEPFTYGLNLSNVYESESLFNTKALNIMDAVLVDAFGGPNPEVFQHYL